MILIGQMHIEKARPGAWTGILVTGATSGADAQIDQADSKKASDVPGGPGGAKLDPRAERNLKWGPPVNGLRAAVVIRHSADKPKAGAMPDLYVVVQNVSDVAIRFNDTLAEEQPRMLYIKIDGRTVAGIGAKDPRLGDVFLQAGEVAFMPMYSLEPLADGHSTGAIIAEGVLKDSQQSLVAHLQIEKAPAGAWTGKLVTGETSGSVAVGQPQPKDRQAQRSTKCGSTMRGKTRTSPADSSAGWARR